MSKTYEQHAGFISNLTEKLGDNDHDLPIFEEHLAMLKKRLNKNKYTFLKLIDGTHVEYIKVSDVNGSLMIERGLELTKPRTFPKGSCVKWELTPTAVRDIVCQMPCCP